MAAGRFVKTQMKRTLKTAAAVAGVVTPSAGDVGRILTYHNIGHRDHEMNVTPDHFRDQMEWLSKHVPVLPLSAVAYGEPGVAITLDDGYRDNLLNAAPVLKQYGFPATVFVVAGFLGERLDGDSEDTRIMTAEELVQWEASGLQVGAHTMTHRRLSTLRHDEQEFEIGQSKIELERALGHALQAFAYPYGSALDYNAESISCIREADFTHAFSNRYGSVRPSDGPWAYRRIWIDRSDSLETFVAKVTGRLDALSVLDSAPGIWSRRVMNRILGTR